MVVTKGGTAAPENGERSRFRAFAPISLEQLFLHGADYFYIL
jgi:hypothetical protein